MSQMDLTYSYVLKSPAQLDNPEQAIGLVALGPLFNNAVGVHPASLDDKSQAVETLVALLDKTYQCNPDRPLRVMLNEQSTLALRDLKGGESEPREANPAMGLRGVSRFASAVGKPGFVLECDVLKSAIRDKNLPVEIVVPFVRTSSEAATIIDLLAEQGLCRGANGLKVLVACQLPSNAVLAEPLLAYFDGFVVDVDNLAAFTLGVDFSDTSLPHAFNKNNEAIRSLILDTIRKTQLAEKPIQVLTQETDTSIIELAEAANVELVYQ
ncbi:phosphoenolpyruvate synthase [Enterovibrio norvegicus FF-33]|uniref:Phosphoenolpyruvate synthase n=1 Tax=Enterovibrio norvegicus FF-454 TaxID=1185651 RepID=A0A1E5C9M7_9GAMM|nr:putative PEP-binding protein [Enterovibrio norvegicus]OEE62223.1 phosphoenolpyruvate synthase [Enterovibrio norvegicus FF-454]OEE65808.1 phosphoenolpyruvate synthase [Enterovibrio norvegicus FF-33]OEE89160.1 phosphoenolpyruvate synthase [Enterovibrio norvegicus FF-162]